MKKKLPWFLLVVSVCFNLFFLAGAAKARKVLQMLKTPEGRVEWVGKRIGLDKDQRQAVQVLMTRQNTKLKELQKVWKPEFEKYWRVVTDPDADRSRIEGAIEDLYAPFKKGAIIKTECFRDILELLTREQKQALIELIRKKNAEPR
jgi:Spy/CpxP family protein refolding chaperone